MAATDEDRPLRSALYVPGSNARAVEKARGLPVDAIIYDLEDAVAPDAKARARSAVVDALARRDARPKLRAVRVNGLGTPWGRDDLDALRGRDCDAVLVPKADGPADLDAVAAHVAADVPLWAMMETARGVLAAAAIAAHPRLGGMAMGLNDLAAELGCRVDADRTALRTALQHCVLAARAAGVPILDGVHDALRDDAGLAAECAQGRDWGFDGKTLIHPAQVAAANAAFAPTPAERDLARRRIAAHEAAVAAGQGVAVLDGRIVENLHVDSARRTLARSAAIEALEERT